jgi:DEAD/DEAH box helicase domain-containing protein
MDGPVVVFDLETQRDIASVGGRGFLERLGLSVAVAYNMDERRFFHYDESQVNDLVDQLQRASLVVGFAIKGFDLRVLSAYTTVNLWQLPCCDLLEEIERSLGHRVSLDSLARQTLGIRKSADGTLALKWWREGRLDLLRDYCQQDVDVTRRLWEYGRAHGHLWYWDQKRRQRRPVPVVLQPTIHDD